MQEDAVEGEVLQDGREGPAAGDDVRQRKEHLNQQNKTIRTHLKNPNVKHHSHPNTRVHTHATHATQLASNDGDTDPDGAQIARSEGWIRTTDA